MDIKNPGELSSPGFEIFSRKILLRNGSCQFEAEDHVAGVFATNGAGFFVDVLEFSTNGQVFCVGRLEEVSDLEFNVANVFKAGCHDRSRHS